MLDTALQAGPVLQIDALDVRYGEAVAVQGVSFRLERGVVSIVGRNGMGKTTLCNAIVGLKTVRAGDILLFGQPIHRLKPHTVQRLGIGYVPQGRRIWPSLTVHEHLELARSVTSSTGRWTVERVYAAFPRLAERRRNGGNELSGGEQQMLAIARALLGNPKLLIMDEPTEGLAPVIVERVVELILQVSRDEGVAVLLVEQNIGVATAVAQEVLIMTNGQITQRIEAARLAADRSLQQQLLGVAREH